MSYYNIIRNIYFFSDGFRWIDQAIKLLLSIQGTRRTVNQRESICKEVLGNNFRHLERKVIGHNRTTMQK